MEFLQELFVTAFLAVVFFFIVAISIALAGSEDKKNDDNKEKTMAVEEVKLDRRLKVQGDKSKKRVKFADDVVVKNVDHFDVAEEPIKDFELSEKLSEKVGVLSKFSEGVTVGEESEEAKATRVDDQFGGEGVVKESEVMPYGEEIFKECDDVNTSREVKGDDDEEKRGCKDVGLLDKVLEREFVEQKTEAIKADDFHGVRGKNEVVGSLEALDVGDKMISDETGRDSALELVKGDIEIDQKGGDEASGTNSSELLDEALEGETIEKIIERAEVNLDKSCVGGGSEDMAVDKKIKDEVLDGKNDVKVVLDDTAVCQNEESEAEKGLEKENIDDEDDDDWEEVETSELEKMFAEAVHYVECGGKGKDDQLANLGSDVRMQLYGLHRLALEGPCQEPQPMALKVSARAKWNAWQRLVSMSPEVAMVQYIKLLSDANPGWMHHSADNGKHDFIGSELTDSSEAEKTILQDIQANAEDGRLKNEKA